MAKNYVCASTPYLSKNTSYCVFMLHKFRMTSPDVFFHFLKFWFCGLLVGEGVELRISGTVPHMIVVFGTYTKNDDKF